MSRQQSDACVGSEDSFVCNASLLEHFAASSDHPHDRTILMTTEQQVHT